MSMSARYPGGPFVELSFYVAGEADLATFGRLVEALSARGARFIGDGYVHRGAGMRAKPFEFRSSEPTEWISISSIPSLRWWQALPDVRVVEVDLQGVVETHQETFEVVTCDFVSPAALGVDHHPVAAWADGSVFDLAINAPGDGHKRPALAAGERVYGTFMALVAELDPAYAAITIEHGLACPTNLRRNSRLTSFDNFYVSRAALGRRRIAAVRDLYRDAFQELTPAGVYISTWECFNPERGGPGFTSTDFERSMWLGQLLSDALLLPT